MLLTNIVPRLPWSDPDKEKEIARKNCPKYIFEKMKPENIFS